MPFAGDALQLVRSAVVERDSRPADEIFHRLGYQHLSWAGSSSDTSSRVYRYSCQLLASELALSSVQPAANVESDSTHGFTGPSPTVVYAM
jgi:hypothetical protein